MRLFGGASRDCARGPQRRHCEAVGKAEVMERVNGVSPLYTAAELLDDHQATIGAAIRAWGPEATAEILRALADMIERGEIPAEKMH